MALSSPYFWMFCHPFPISGVFKSRVYRIYFSILRRLQRLPDMLVLLYSSTNNTIIGLNYVKRNAHGTERACRGQASRRPPTTGNTQCSPERTGFIRQIPPFNMELEEHTPGFAGECI